MSSSNTVSDSSQELLEAAASAKRKRTDPGLSYKRVKSGVCIEKKILPQKLNATCTKPTPNQHHLYTVPRLRIAINNLYYETIKKLKLL